MAIVRRALQSDLINLTIDTAKNTVVVVNQDPARAALFNVFSAAGDVIWSYTQAPGTSATIPIPTIDNNGAAINWVVGPITNPKTGVTTQGITSPPNQLTMVA